MLRDVGQAFIIVRQYYHQCRSRFAKMLPVPTRQFVTSPRQHFGDLQGGSESLQEHERQILSRFPSPLDRFILTADGTLQLLVSAWHNRIVKVKPIHIQEHPDELRVERNVELFLGELEDEDKKPFCSAHSVIQYEEKSLMVQAKGCGIGQMFRIWNILPTFELLEANLNRETGKLWRRYRLWAPGVVCDIHETFPLNPLQLPIRHLLKPSTKRDTVESRGVTSDARLSGTIPPELTPIQRVFCSATGNVQRLAAAALGEPISIHLLTETRNTDGSFNRQVELSSDVSSKRFCFATSEIHIYDAELRSEVWTSKQSLGNILARLGAYPDFQLLAVNYKSPSSFSRTYRLVIPSNQVEFVVHEDFDWECFDQMNLGEATNSAA